MRLTSQMTKEVSAIHEHAFRNELDSIRNCLKNAPESVDSTDKHGRTPLIIAARFNRHDVIDVLMTSSQCDLNIQDDNGSTAMHEAADRGYTAVVKKLTETGRCKVNLQNEQGQTALMMAAVYDYIDIVRIILNSGQANLDISDNLGQTALHVALREGSHMAVDALITAGCDVKAIDKTGKSALYMAIHSPLLRSLDPAKRIVEAGCDLSIDKMWILNEEKHNLFYQDDEFYTNIRRQMRRTGSSADTQCQPTDRPGLQRNNSSPPLSLSPMIKQKIITSEAFTKGHVSMDWKTPPGSPVRSRRSSSKSSGSRSTLASKSSFDSENGDSPCFSPSAFAYPTAHIEYHSLTRMDTVFSDTSITSFRNYNETNSAGNTDKADVLRMSNDVNRNTSVITVTNLKRHQSEKITRDNVVNSDIQRKISLPCKPSVQFSNNIEIINTSKKI